MLQENAYWYGETVSGGLLGGINLYGYVSDPNQWIDPLGLAGKYTPTDSIKLGKKGSSSFLDIQGGIKEGREMRKASDLAACKAEKAKRDKVDSAPVDAQDVVAEQQRSTGVYGKAGDIGANEASLALENAGKPSPKNLAQTYGYYTPGANDCKTLLATPPAKGAMSYDQFFKK